MPRKPAPKKQQNLMKMFSSPGEEAAKARVSELERHLETVNGHLGRANDTIDSLRVEAETQADRTAFILARTMDVKGKLIGRGSLEDSLLVHHLAQAEMRSSPLELTIATLIQKAKTMATLPEFDQSIYDDFLQTAKKLV